MSGHLGERIASLIFDIETEPTTAAPGIDGRHCAGRTRGRTVNVKLCLNREGPIDTSDSGPPRLHRPARSNFLTAALKEHS